MTKIVWSQFFDKGDLIVRGTMGTMYLQQRIIGSTTITEAKANIKACLIATKRYE